MSITKEPLRYWLLNKGETGNDWSENLKMNTEFKKLLKDDEIFNTKIDDVRCISLIHKDNLVAPFEIEIVDCNEKRQAVCRKDVPNVHPGGNPSTFPCIVNGHSRTKRQDIEEQGCEDNVDSTVTDSGIRNKNIDYIQ